MRNRIFFSIVILMIIAATLSGVLIIGQSHTFYINVIKQNMVNLGSVIASADSKDYNDIVNKYQNVQKGTKIEFLGNGNKLLAGNGFEFETQSLDAPEVTEAYAKGFAFSVRNANNSSKQFLFYAVKINSDVLLRIAEPIDGFGGILGNAILAAVGGIFFIVLVAAVISYFISKNLVKPIIELSNTISAVADGDYSVRAPTDTYNEISQLAQNFNKMAGSLDYNISLIKEHSNRINQIIRNMEEGFVALDKNLNIELINNRAIDYLNYKGFVSIGKNLLIVSRNIAILDCVKEVTKTGQPSVTDIQSNGRDIRVFISLVEHGGLVLFLQNVTKIKRVENMRSEFTANVSHELKTPLTSIKGFAETLKNGAIENEEVALSFLDIITKEADRLSNLISDILQLSEIETMKIETNIEKISICNILMQVESILQTTAKSMNVKLDINCESINIKANPDRIKQLFLNLIENSIKYNKDGGSVFCSVKSEGIFVVICVKDTGIGINDRDLPRIFERFYRADKSRSKKVGGTGLGLSIVKHIINLYGGTIDVHSEIGVGTEFVVSLPVIENNIDV